MLGYVFAYRPMTQDGSIVTVCGRRFCFSAKPADTVLRGGDWVHFEPQTDGGATASQARIIARADQLASAWVTSGDAADFLAELAASTPADPPA